MIHDQAPAKGVSCKIGSYFYLLRRNVEGNGPEVSLGVGVDAGDDEEDSRATSAARYQTTQSEDDRPLILLHHFDAEEQRKGQTDDDDHDRDEGESNGTKSGVFDQTRGRYALLPFPLFGELGLAVIGSRAAHVAAGE